VGFSSDGLVLVRHVSEQFGPGRFEVLATSDGSEVELLELDTNAEPGKVEADLKTRHQIESVGFPGPVAPDRTAAVMVLPGPLHGSRAFEYSVQLVDGHGPHDVALIPVPHACEQPMVAAHSRITARWAPDGRSAVLAGSVQVEAECGSPRSIPVLVLVRATEPAGERLLMNLASVNGAVASQLARPDARGHNRSPEALVVYQQLLALTPDEPRLLMAIARLHAAAGRDGRALSALWALRNAPGEDASVSLRRAISAPWSATLRRRAAWQALAWAVERDGGEL